jgi:glycerophosphoryl diester phosphodiesterase
MKRKLKIMGFVILILVLIWVIFGIIPPKKVIAENPFIIKPGDKPLVAAHRGGKNLNPENTFMAFDDAVYNYQVDILELDLCLTKDGKLVASHDLWINDLCDVEEVSGSSDKYYILEHTLEELREFNFGAKFTDKNGNQPYKDLVSPDTPNRKEIIRANKLAIATAEEIFAAYKDTKLMYIVEIKDSGEAGKLAADRLNYLITEKFKDCNLLKRVVIGTFHTEIENYLKEKYPKIMRGGSTGEVTKFVLTQMFGVNIFDNSSFVCLQIPTEAEAFGITFDLTRKTYINRAHRRNISVQYWTINDKEEMRMLIELGADVIMTDNPDLFLEVLEEMGYL